MPGFADLVLILVVVMIVFGAGKLPVIATAIGRFIVRLRGKSQEEPDEPGPSGAT